MDLDLILIKEIVIVDPPTKYTIAYKKPKFDSNGKAVLKQDYYLTSNLFFNSNMSFHITSKITTECKRMLYPYLKGLPELEKMRTEMEIHRDKDIDLDNVGFFWRKLIMDILKTPTSRQLVNAHKRKSEIITVNCIFDDNTKTVLEHNEKFFKGENKIVLRIYGRVKTEQKELDLFFI